MSKAELKSWKFAIRSVAVGKKDRSLGNENVYSLTPSVKTNYCASQKGHESGLYVPTVLRLFKQTRPTLTSPPNDAII